MIELRKNLKTMTSLQEVKTVLSSFKDLFSKFPEIENFEIIDQTTARVNNNRLTFFCYQTYAENSTIIYSIPKMMCVIRFDLYQEKRSTVLSVTVKARYQNLVTESKVTSLFNLFTI